MKYFLTYFAIFITDQFSKFYIEKNIKDGEKIEIVKDKFYITNCKNKGGAYGVFAENKSMLSILSSFSLISVISSFFMNISKNNKKKAFPFLFIFSGGSSNIYNRVKKNYVTDFIYIKGKNMPIFNVADIFVFIGCIISVFQYIINTEDKK